MPCFEMPHSRIEPITFRTLLLVLYGTALRISEALSLTLADVDLDQMLFYIRESKFYNYAESLAMLIRMELDHNYIGKSPAGGNSDLFQVGIVWILQTVEKSQELAVRPISSGFAIARFNFGKNFLL